MKGDFKGREGGAGEFIGREFGIRGTMNATVSLAGGVGGTEESPPKSFDGTVGGLDPNPNACCVGCVKNVSFEGTVGGLDANGTDSNKSLAGTVGGREGPTGKDDGDTNCKSEICKICSDNGFARVKLGFCCCC